MTGRWSVRFGRPTQERRNEPPRDLSTFRKNTTLELPPGNDDAFDPCVVVDNFFDAESLRFE